MAAFLTAAALILGGCSGDATADKEAVVTETVLENALKVGKFYLNGDTSSSFIEVYDDGTLQWQDFDFEGYLREINKQYDERNGVSPEEAAELEYGREENIKQNIEWMSARHSYAVVRNDLTDVTKIVFEYDPAAEAERGWAARSGWVYTDEYTIDVSNGGGLIYRYVEE